MISLDENQLKLLNATVIAAVVTAVVAFVSKVIELIILWRNKKKEIDYTTEAEVKKEVREHATMIVACSNEIAVGINSYIDLLGKSIEISNGRENLTNNEENTKQVLEVGRGNKINQINENSIKIVTHLIQFQLYFSDSKYEHEAVKKAMALQKVTVSLKEALFEIQEDFSPENFEEGKDRLVALTEKINILIPEFSIATRKTLRLFSYRLRGRVRLIDLIEYSGRPLVRVFNKNEKNYWKRYWRNYWRIYWALYFKELSENIYYQKIFVRQSSKR